MNLLIFLILNLIFYFYAKMFNILLKYISHIIYNKYIQIIILWMYHLILHQ